jgi:hypothetical protein
LTDSVGQSKYSQPFSFSWALLKRGILIKKLALELVFIRIFALTYQYYLRQTLKGKSEHGALALSAIQTLAVEAKKAKALNVWVTGRLFAFNIVKKSTLCHFFTV